jgi:hypothetical protein
MWFRSDYEKSPITDWDFFGYLVAISLFAMPLGLIVRSIADFAGFILFVFGAACAFVGGGVITWKDIQKVTSGEEKTYDDRLLFPFFTTSILIPFFYFCFDSEAALMWGIIGSVFGGYAVGSLLERERSQGPPANGNK